MRHGTYLQLKALPEKRLRVRTWLSDSRGLGRANHSSMLFEALVLKLTQLKISVKRWLDYDPLHNPRQMLLLRSGTRTPNPWHFTTQPPHSWASGGIEQSLFSCFETWLRPAPGANETRLQTVLDLLVKRNSGWSHTQAAPPFKAWVSQIRRVR